MSDLDGNPEDRFSHAAAHMKRNRIRPNVDKSKNELHVIP